MEAPRELLLFGKKTLLLFFFALLGVALVLALIVYLPLNSEIVGKNKAEKRFSQIADITEEFIWEIDLNGLYTYANPLVEKILGYQELELIG